MTKIPVQRTVMRDGKPHIQTYWEESDPKNSRPTRTSLSNLAVPLPGQNAVKEGRDPVREAWNRSSLVSRAAVKRHDEDVEAFIAAGFTPEAAHYLTSHVIPKGESPANFIYDNGMDQLPRPREGWQSAGGSDDQRKAWLMEMDKSELALEQAVEWIDAGFPFPSTGIADLIKNGVSAERAMQWESFAQTQYAGTGKTGGFLYLYKEELTSDITLEEAQEWRVAINGHGNQTPLSSKDMEYRSSGFTAEEASRWSKVVYVSTPVEKVASLKAMGYTPTSIKGLFKEVGKFSRNASLLSEGFADDLIKATPLFGGPRVVKGWIAIAYESDMTLDDPMMIKAVRDAEAFKAHAKKVTGVAIQPEDHKKLASLLPKQREAYLEVMNTEGRKDTKDYMVSRAMDLAKTIGSAENYRFLEARGFPLGVTDDGKVVHANGHPTGGYSVFDAESASPEDQNKWMRSAATSMYWKNYYETPVSGDDMRKVVENPDIDPIKLKDTLLAYRGAIKPVQLEGILLSGINSSVSTGWL